MQAGFLTRSDAVRVERQPAIGNEVMPRTRGIHRGLNAGDRDLMEDLAKDRSYAGGARYLLELMNRRGRIEHWLR